MTNEFPFAQPGSALRRRIYTFMMAGTLAFPAWAGSWQQLDQTIFGMDCAPCAAGVEKSLLKLHGVKAVHVSLNEGRTVVSLSPGSRTTLAQIREAIRHNGFTPQDARGTLLATVQTRNGSLWVEAAGVQFRLRPPSGGTGIPSAVLDSGHEVLLQVLIPERPGDPPTLEIVSFEHGA